LVSSNRFRCETQPIFLRHSIVMKHYIALTISLLVFSLNASAQKWSVSTNAVEWANLGTINLEASAAVGRHATVGVGAKYNPWVFGGEDKQLQNKQRTAYVLGRWWPWFIYSGWWFGGKAQWSEYSQGGIFSRETEEGDAYGAGLSAGYTLLLKKNLNLEFSAGFWGGYKTYTVYACPTCGRIVDSGAKAFILPDNVAISLMFIF